MAEKPDRREIGGKGITENLSHEQRKDLMSLMKRMLPPVPSLGIIDVRFSFWLIRRWYIVVIFGKDNRNQFKAMDLGDMDKSLTNVARFFTYIIMTLVILILVLFLLYLLKSYLGIDIFPDRHLQDVLLQGIRG